MLRHREADLTRKDQRISELEAELIARQQGLELTNAGHRKLMVDYDAACNSQHELTAALAAGTAQISKLQVEVSSWSSTIRSITMAAHTLVSCWLDPCPEAVLSAAVGLTLPSARLKQSA